ncbi:MAG: flagellar biosynthesis anti-sigma factor FlgM [Hyphomonadaceae bacterium]|nr:flagellar biosynthesis anti-sigma factor FlgM [Clostridia bacterium]
MSIQRVNGSNVLGLYKKSQNEVHQIKTEKTVAKDAVILSESGKIFQNALKSIKDAPDIRAAKVQQISDQIKAGKYQVSSEELSSKIVKGAFFDKSI